jgi:PH domain/leucine-rich repeat-containing protein phosphatase
VPELDIRPLRTLEYLNVERNGMTSLQLNGIALKNLFAAYNGNVHFRGPFQIT